jgi:predicted enzyme related to lactoylglutathione lyase
MFKDLKRVTYQVGDMEAARNWYGDLLGMKPLYDSPVAAVFKIGEILLIFVQGKDLLKEDCGRVVVYWEVDDVDEAFQKMIDRGASSNAEPANYPGKRIARVLDPFGNIIGLAGRINQTPLPERHTAMSLLPSPS